MLLFSRDAVRRLSHDSHVRLCMHQDTPSLHIKTASGDDRFMQLSDKSHFPNVHLDVSPCGLYVVYALYTNLEDPPVRGFGCSRLDGTGCITVQTRAVPFYFSWSPDSRYVAWLGSHQDNITFEVRVSVAFCLLLILLPIRCPGGRPACCDARVASPGRQWRARLFRLAPERPPHRHGIWRPPFV